MSYSVSITPTNTWVGTIPAPDDGDQVLVTDEQAVIQKLADRDQVLLERLMPLTIVQPLVAFAENAIAEYEISSGGYTFVTKAVNANQYLMMQLSGLVDGATLTSVSVGVVGPGGYGGTPAVVNKFTVWRAAPTTGAASQVGGTATDPATSGGSPDMDEHRLITLAGLTEVIDLTTYMYLVKFEHESGANAQAGVNIYAAQVTLTRPTT